MILGQNIDKSFGDKVLFKDFNFRISDGEFVCFSGESGTGKTTLLNIIGLFEPIDGGRLTINGKEYKSNREIRDYYRHEVGFLFQNFALIENKTVRRNLSIVRQKDRSNMSMDDALGIVGLVDKFDSKVYTLSGGEQQRVALARLMIKECNIILADEPTGSLDRRNADIVISLLRRINEEGRTVVMVTHDERIKGMADRVIEL